MTPSTVPAEVPAEPAPVLPEQAAREQALVDEVVASFAGAESARLRQLMQALARHLHAFVRETRLTEEEWAAAIEFLTAAATSRTTSARSSSCSPTSWVSRCRRSR